jgi:hypothetical protein
MRRRWAILLALAASAAAATPALADRIDGDWCARDGRNLSINGPQIRTPEGTLVMGDYSRHQFRYVAPAGAPDAGQPIFMQLFDEEDMGLAHVVNGVAGPMEAWHRCNVTS